MFIFFISPVFAEPVEIEIDWTIEGQPKNNLIKSQIVEESNTNVNQNADNNYLHCTALNAALSDPLRAGLC